MNPQRKKKVDHQALMSPFARIPGLNAAAARVLIDLGFAHIEELRGRSPEVLYDQLLKLPQHKGISRESLYAIRLAVYFAETPEPEPAKLQIWQWMD